MMRDMQSRLDTFRKLGINAHRSSPAEMNFLNPYFGYSDKDNDAYDCRGLYTVSLFAADDIRIYVIPRGFGRGSHDLYAHELTDRQIEGIADLVRKVHDERLADIRRTQAGPLG